MKIVEALNLKERAFISLVGAGGKSTLFNRLAEELTHKNKRIILTTTTKMFSWQLAPFIKKGKLVDGHQEERVYESIKRYFSREDKRGRLAVVVKEIEGINQKEKIAGPPTAWLDKWWTKEITDYFLVEADGAAGRSAKAPASYEPVVPLSTTDLIGVIGIDVLGLPLQEENVFRSTIFSQLTGLAEGEKIGIEALSQLVCHPQGLFKKAPPGCHCHLFINKVEDAFHLKEAEELAFEVLKFDHQRISNIIIGAASQKEVIVKIIRKVEEG